MCKRKYQMRMQYWKIRNIYFIFTSYLQIMHHDSIPAVKPNRGAKGWNQRTQLEISFFFKEDNFF